MSDQGEAGRPAAGPDEEELQRAYEAELASISVGEIVLQSAVSMVNLGGMRLGLGGGPDGAGVRDLDQARDAIDAVRGLMPVLERHAGAHLRSIRDALAQLQFAYSREVAAAATPAAEQAPEPAAPGGAPPGRPSSQAADGGDQAGADQGGKADAEQGREPDADQGGKPGAAEGPPAPGPAESSGRLWVPGRR